VHLARDPEHLVQDVVPAEAERGWDAAFSPRLVLSSTERGRNLIHDGPSLLETARWLAGRLAGPRREPPSAG
jgi:iron complex transport system substrate-binding protein